MIIYTMQDFYFYACVIALIILIILLAMIGIAISYSKKLLIYPPTYKNCPDYWTEGNGDGTNDNGKPNYCLYPTEATYRNRGDGSFNHPSRNPLPRDYADLNELSYLAYYGNAKPMVDTINPSNESAVAKYYIQMNGNDASWNTIYSNSYAGLTTRCAKRKWAIDNGIVWDGITNYNGCT